MCLLYRSICFLLPATCVLQQAKCGLEAVLKERYLDFLDILITARDENGEGLSHQEIRDEVDTFLFAGNESCCPSVSHSDEYSHHTIF